MIWTVSPKKRTNVGLGPRRVIASSRYAASRCRRGSTTTRSGWGTAKPGRAARDLAPIGCCSSQSGSSGGGIGHRGRQLRRGASGLLDARDAVGCEGGVDAPRVQEGAAVALEGRGVVIRVHPLMKFGVERVRRCRSEQREGRSALFFFSFFRRSHLAFILLEQKRRELPSLSRCTLCSLAPANTLSWSHGAPPRAAAAAAHDRRL